MSTIEGVLATDAYALATERAALVDRSERAKIVLTGAGAADFLDGQVTNAVGELEAGEGCYAAFLNPKGKLRADVRILRLAEGFWVDAEGYAKQVVDWVIANFSVGLEVTAEDLTADHAILSVIGPDARAALDVDPPDAEHSHVRTDDAVYVATDLGVDVLCGSAKAAAVRERLEEVPFEIAEILRVESGRPRLGLEMDGNTIPQEAGINDRAVSFTKGCYVGQETVARLHYKGKPNRRLRGLRLSEPVERGAVIRLGEREVGTVGSAAESPALGPVALALVRREAEDGATVEVGDAGATAELVALPFAR